MSNTIVVYVHGVWMPADVMMFVKHHLETEHDFKGQLFGYPSVRGSLDENAALLEDFISQISADCIHLVGHSLGGVVVLRMLSLYPETAPGNVVCMGSPLCGSRAAEFLRQTEWGNLILGRSMIDGVVKEAANDWATKVTNYRNVGCIAGTVPRGIGRLLTTFAGESDGTVAVSETRLPGIKDHICLPVTHSGLVISRTAANQAANFLKNGEFFRESGE